MGYCDGELSVQWIKGVGGRVMNLLTKGSEKHCREQLRQTPEQHRKRVQETILAAHKRARRGERLPRRLVERRARFLRLRLRDGAGAARAARRAHLPARHAGRLRAGRDRALRRPDDRRLARRPLRVPRPQRLRTGGGQLHGRGARRRARRAHQRERDGRARRQHAARRSGRRAARPHARTGRV